LFASIQLKLNKARIYSSNIAGDYSIFAHNDKRMKDFKKYYTIPASAEDLYLALTNPLTIHLWSGEEAQMSTEPGSEFSLWEGSIVGKNLEFEQNKKIVQQWYFGEQDAPSIVTLKLHPKGENLTSVELRHTNIPDEDYDDIVEGWNDVYFGALIDFYEE
jgi:activator of HSP90 ATPase